MQTGSPVNINSILVNRHYLPLKHASVQLYDDTARAEEKQISGAQLDVLLRHVRDNRVEKISFNFVDFASRADGGLSATYFFKELLTACPSLNHLEYGTMPHSMPKCEHDVFFSMLDSIARSTSLKRG